jgi:hypothetical protein
MNKLYIFYATNSNTVLKYTWPKFRSDIILPSRNTRSNQPKKLSKCTGILLDKVSSGQVGLAQFLYCGLYYF